MTPGFKAFTVLSSTLFAILRETTEINAEKLKQKKTNEKKNSAHFILIAKDVFIALAVVVAKAPYINESDSSIFNWFYCKLV